MGQKIHPRGFRLGIIEDWDSSWYAEGQAYSDNVNEDIKIRKFLKDKLYKAGIARIRIARRANQIEIIIFTAKPGLIIGKGGRDIAAIRDEVIMMTKKQVQIDIQEVSNPESNAQLVAENIALQLEKRIAFRRAMRQAVMKALRSGGKGIKVMVGGRLGGSEIARSEWYRKGRVPLHTLRARIEYGFTEAMTVYGKIGVKVWVYRGDVLPQTEKKPVAAPEEKVISQITL